MALHGSDRRASCCHRQCASQTPRKWSRAARPRRTLPRHSVLVGSVGPGSQPIPAVASPLPLVERTFEHNWRTPLPDHDHPDPRRRPILALGKFDAMHKGHQALAAAALHLGGTPVLLSFSGMAAVLGWQPRKPLVAPCDRPRILHLWAQQLHDEQLQQQHLQQQGLLSKKRPAPQQQQQQQQQQGKPQPPGDSSYIAAADDAASQCQQQDDAYGDAGGVVPVRQRYIPFAEVRSMTPEAFVELITRDFGAAGVVCGANYRFGFRAAGDTALLQRLCGSAGLPVAVVELVGAAEPGAVGVVSSSKIREMLGSRRIDAVRKSLGRSYRLVTALHMGGELQRQQQWWQHWQQQRVLLLQQQQEKEQQASPPISSSISSQADVNVSAVASEAVQASYQGAFIQPQCFLNQQPGPGIYSCNVQLFIGATAHDDLLLLQQAAEQVSAAAGSGNSSSGSSSSIEVLSQLQVAGSGCWACVRGWQQQVQCLDEGLLLPWELLEAAQTCLDSSSTRSHQDTFYAAMASSSHSSDQKAAAVDPLCWDTDDNEEAGGEAGGGVPFTVLGSDDFTTAAAAAAAAGEGPSVLMVFDFEQCVQQICSVPKDWLDEQ